MHRHSSAAFSLVELSIVLVILGLLTGGILSGQALIRASELRAVNTEFQRYTTAMSTFRDKYFSIPGDFTKASGTGGFGWTDAAAVAAANGDGNGAMTQTAAVGTNEISGFWVHLASAGLIEGSYTGVANTTFTAGTHNPRSKLGSANWNIANLGTVANAGTITPDVNATDAAASTFFAGTYGTALLFGTGTSAILPGGTLKAEEAWNLDTKADDGLPDQGGIRSLESQGNVTAGTGCSDRATSTSALAASSYDLASTSSTSCSLVFKTGY